MLPLSNLFYTPSFQENFPAFFYVGPPLEDIFSGHIPSPVFQSYKGGNCNLQFPPLLNNLPLCAPFCSAWKRVWNTLYFPSFIGLRVKIPIIKNCGQALKRRKKHALRVTKKFAPLFGIWVRRKRSKYCQFITPLYAKYTLIERSNNLHNLRPFNFALGAVATFAPLLRLRALTLP